MDEWRRLQPRKAGPYKVVGKPLPKVDAYSTVTGRAIYADDIMLPRMLYGGLLRSPHPHARIISINTRKARELPGVLAVITGEDLPRKYGILPSSQDETALAVDKVRYVGDPVAAVAATDPDTLEQALRLIEVEYEVLPVLMGIEEALAHPDIKIHEETRNGNIHKAVSYEFGDIEAGFAAADYVREDWFYYEGNNHVPIEAHACLARWEPDPHDPIGGKLTLWSSTQTPHYVHREVSKVLGIPPSHLRVIAPHVGGGFGGKSDPFSHEICACELARRTGRPVKITCTREEVFLIHRGRHPVKMWIKTGVKRDGTITAMHFRSFLDGGAYGSYGVATTYYTGALQPVTYALPAYKFEGMRVFTNKPPCGPKRGHGTPQPRFAVEVHLDKIAADLGIDPIELRKRNLVRPYSRTINGLRITSCALEECLDQVVARSGWREFHAARLAREAEAVRQSSPVRHGMGLALSTYICGAGKPIYWNDMPHSAVQIRLDRGGGVTVYCGATDIGQGSTSVLAYIVAEELGVEPERIHLETADTTLTPVDLGSYSSRVTFMAGNAAIQAARRLKELLHSVAAERLRLPPDRLESGDGFIYCVDDPQVALSFEQAVQLAEARYGALVAAGSYAPPEDIHGDFKGAGVGPSPAYSYSACVALVGVDIETGEVKVEKLWLAHDVGQAINPLLVAGQVEGSAYMGYGEALMEQQIFRKGRHKIPSILDYKIPTTLDTPEIETILVGQPDDEGPFGGKEAGQGPLLPVIPAIANAVYNAVGIRIDEVPITPDKVLRALKAAHSEPGERPLPPPRVTPIVLNELWPARLIRWSPEHLEQRPDPTNGHHQHPRQGESAPHGAASTSSQLPQKGGTA
ncbi:MAG: molybdopterin-dependent oxidoreductase [Thermogemmatispora sp.]|uniref:molybdopterin cofactor-binding domain-containing protein n=1 Tax=Thermogemmatispora sp. TaxID=1968838 RepID=UPI00262B2FD1|nr:molybdopterin cofactor-binding domain-containing protein [Thermogemmatispora sp.]MBX5455817.1 molybdopterin-dependent oxidoreductase [Thermogemmatispora sp.]